MKKVFLLLFVACSVIGKSQSKRTDTNVTYVCIGTNKAATYNMYYVTIKAGPAIPQTIKDSLPSNVAITPDEQKIKFRKDAIAHLK
jgi:hypothetical protein